MDELERDGLVKYKLMNGWMGKYRGGLVNEMIKHGQMVRALMIMISLLIEK